MTLNKDLIERCKEVDHVLDDKRGVISNLESAFSSFFTCEPIHREMWEKELIYWTIQFGARYDFVFAKKYREVFVKLKDYESRINRI